MRKPIIITLCIVCCFAITPFVVGVFVQQHYTANIEQNTSNQLAFMNKSYTRGWLKSSATTQLDINDIELLDYYQKLYKTDKPLQLIIQHNIQHGPILMTGDGLRFGLASTQEDIHFSDATASEIKQLTEGEQPASASSLLHFSGESDISIHIAAIEAQNLQGQVKLAPTQINVTLSESMLRLKASIRNADVHITTKKTTLELTKFYLDIDQYHQKQTPLGKWHLSFDSAHLSKNNQTLLDSKAFSSTSALELQKDDPSLVMFSQRTSIGVFNLQDMVYGPGTFNMKASNIPKKLLETIAHNMQQPLVNNVSHLLSKGLHIDMDTFNFSTPQGDVIGHLNAQLPPMSPKQMKDMAYLRANSEISLDLSAPIEFIDATPLVTQLPLMLMFGIIENKDGVYSVQANLHEGKLRLNGKDMPF